MQMLGKFTVSLEKPTDEIDFHRKGFLVELVDYSVCFPSTPDRHN